jgi:tetratricopeptide (TPR) repeat protein
MKTAHPGLMAVFLGVLAFTLATAVEPRFRSMTQSSSDEGAFTKLLGDGRRMFSGQAVELADVYLHSGYYPSIFDGRDASAPKAISSKGGDHDDDGDHHEEHKHDEHGNCVHGDEHDAAHEEAMSFMGTPRDWLEAFIRNFRITQHTHLENGEEREVLPWLKLAIELNPQALPTYIDTSYWLWRRLGRLEDARGILREGIRNNPSSPELLFEMGLLYEQGDKDNGKARNIWLGALRLWKQQTTQAKTNNLDYYGKITANLGHLEAGAGNFSQAIDYYERAKTVSPNPTALQKRVDELKARMQSPASAVPDSKPVR